MKSLYLLPLTSGVVATTTPFNSVNKGEKLCMNSIRIVFFFERRCHGCDEINRKLQMEVSSA
jgi:hypothetical protein